MEEIWKDIDGYEGLYQVSNLGNVRSLNWANRGYSKNLYLKKQNRGYLHVELAKDGIRKSITVHRLVAVAFLENPNNYPFINHIDENKHNNCVENLEWCTPRYNAQYSINLHKNDIVQPGSKRPHIGGKRVGDYGAYKHKKAVLQYQKGGNLIREWETPSLLERETGWRASSIIECCKGRRKTAYGYIWQFAS